MVRNPYQYLRPVKPAVFVGRWTEARRIALDLLLDEGDSYAIIAGRRCGKSSFLLALHEKLSKNSAADVVDCQALPILFDFKSASFASEQHFFAYILQEIQRRVDVNARRRPADAWSNPVKLDAEWFIELSQSAELTLRDFEDAIGYILDQIDDPLQPVRLVLLLDEVDETLDQEWTEALFDRLRSLVYSGDLKDRARLVLSGSRRFLEQVSDRGSPLWNVLKREFLVAFNQAGFDVLVERTENLPTAVADSIWSQCGGHPYLAQYLLYHLLEQSADSGIESASPEMVGSLVSTFCYEHNEDLEGWANAIGETGLQAYAQMVQKQDWWTEAELNAALNADPVDVKRGLIGLCYHGLAQHADGWSHFRSTGQLFNHWYQVHADSLHADGSERQSEEPETNNPIYVQTETVNLVQGDSVQGDKVGQDKIGQDKVGNDKVGQDKISADIKESANIAIGRENTQDTTSTTDNSQKSQ